MSKRRFINGLGIIVIVAFVALQPGLWTVLTDTTRDRNTLEWVAIAVITVWLVLTTISKVSVLVGIEAGIISGFALVVGPTIPLVVGILYPKQDVAAITIEVIALVAFYATLSLDLHNMFFGQNNQINEATNADVLT